MKTDGAINVQHASLCNAETVMGMWCWLICKWDAQGESHDQVTPRPQHTIAPPLEALLG